MYISEVSLQRQEDLVFSEAPELLYVHRQEESFLQTFNH